MGRIFGILCIALGMWVGMEIYLEGARNAFGGAFDFASHAPDETQDRRSTPPRAGDAVRNSLAIEAERRERTMPD
jgi:hypothetical protein